MKQRPYILGLTGSIGMGKSTTAERFADRGIPVWDADATVHQLYSGDTPAVRQIAEMLPEAVENKTVNRDTLKAAIAKDQSILKKLEQIVQPLIAQSRADFVAEARDNDVDIVIIDHPLLLESSSERYCDGVLVVTIDAAEQRRRVLERGTMDEKTLEIILAKQMPDAEKRKRADFIVETTTPEAAERQVDAVIAKIKDSCNA
ncbi:dephospho-CoA kinase [Neptunicoccus cionae]|uniref:Dephospho-CoA kinase n=1 Tax=Neptunicoccus cionae TaxID=2035344 RepID=A0A916VQL9_9RHOB|nr:dephospho-CoA kinase [Amylibacter cionae]GGA18714.1 dephospho-CoA kinase [Amylibacter cionae]